MEFDPIYHYTTLNSLVSMLTSDKDYAVLRLTRLDYLNDSSEYFDFDRIFEIVKSRNERKAKEGDLVKDNDFFANYNSENRLESIKQIFTMSFTTEDDSIPMWNYYSNATGISIGFNKNDLIDEIRTSLENHFSIDSEEMSVLSYDMIYNDSAKIRKLSKWIDNLPSGEGIDKETLAYSYLFLESSGDEFKSEKFTYEQEFRIAIKLPKDKEKQKLYVKYHATSMNIKPYIEVKINKVKFVNLIEKITISPLNTSKMITCGIRDFLETNGHEMKNLVVKASECSLRNL